MPRARVVEPVNQTTQAAQVDDAILAANVQGRRKLEEQQEEESAARAEIKGGRRNKSATSPLPEPPYVRAYPGREGQTGQYKRVEACIDWWHNTMRDYPERLAVYVYRQNPQCDLKLVDPKANTNIEKLYEFVQADESYDPAYAAIARTLQMRYGSGSYRLTFTDSVLGIGNLCEIQITTPWDPDTYPPKVDPRTVLNVPANQSYIIWARLKGITFPWDKTDTPTPIGLPPTPPPPPVVQVQAAPAPGSDPLNALASQLVNLTAQMARPQPQKSDLSAVSEAMSILQQAKAMAGNEDEGSGGRLREALEVARLMIQAQGGNNQQESMLELFRANASTMQSLLQAQIDQANRRAELLEKELAEIRNRPKEVRPSPEAEFDRMAGMVDRILGLKDRFNPDGGGGNSTQNPEPAPKPDDGGILKYMPLVNQALTTLQPLIARALTPAPPVIQYVYPNGQPVPPEALSAAVPMNPAASAGTTVIPGAPNPTPVQIPTTINPAVPQVPQALTPQSTAQMDETGAMVRLISGPAHDFWHRGVESGDSGTGHQLAIWFIDGFGVNGYTDLVFNGPTLLNLAIQQYSPDVWARISIADPANPGMRKPRESWEQFMLEFCDTKEVDRLIKEGEEGESE